MKLLLMVAAVVFTVVVAGPVKDQIKETLMKDEKVQGIDVVKESSGLRGIKKKWRLSDFSNVNATVPERLKKKFGEYVKVGIARDEKQLTNIRKKLKIIKKLTVAQVENKPEASQNATAEVEKAQEHVRKVVPKIRKPKKHHVTKTPTLVQDIKLSKEKLIEANNAWKKAHPKKERKVVRDEDPDFSEILFEDDILLSEAQLDDIIAGVAKDIGLGDEEIANLTDKSVGRSKRQAIRNPNTEPLSNYRWPSNTIPFAFDYDIPVKTKNIVRQAFKNFANQTCLDFIEVLDEDEESLPRLQIRNVTANKCYSPIGYQGEAYYTSSACKRGCDGAGKHPINLGGYWCDDEYGSIAHEIGHALGVYHHQSRYDRDKYIEFLNGDFDTLLSTSNSYNYNQMYDFGSNMHYAPNITTKDDYRLYEQSLGHRAGPAFGDIALINTQYKCLCQNPTVNCVNNGYPNPNGCSKCICPSGFGGDTCSERNTGTNKLGATFYPDDPDTCYSLERTLGMERADPFPYHQKSWYHIKAPVGKKIQMVFWNIHDEYYTENPGCDNYGVELKFSQEIWNRTGYIVCGNNEEFITEKYSLGVKTFETDQELAIVGLYSRQGKLNLVAKYRILDKYHTADDIPECMYPECEDVDENCDYWAGLGLCQDSDYEMMMKDKCPYSCDLC